MGAAALYLAFLVMWGFNYRRVPLAEKLQFDAAGVSAEGTRSLAMTTVDRVNALYLNKRSGIAYVGTDRGAVLFNGSKWMAATPSASSLTWSLFMSSSISFCRTSKKFP